MGGQHQGAIVVTGVSTGIGHAIAADCVKRGWQVFGSVRNDDDAQRLRAELGDRLHPLVFDVTDTDAIRAAVKTAERVLDGRGIRALVNNAGIASYGPLELVNLDELRRTLEVNVVGQVAVTQAFLPMLRPSGRVVMMSSTSGHIAEPFLSAYVASKYALEGTSVALRRELKPLGIKVSIVVPGAIATPIWDKGAELDLSPYDRSEYAAQLRRFREYLLAEGQKGSPPDRVADAVRHAVTSRLPRLRYVVVRRRMFDWYLPRLIPDRAFDLLVARSLRSRARR